MAALSGSRQALLRAVEPLSQDDLDRRPGADAWSPREILDHLAKREAGTVKVCGRLLREGAAGGAGPDANLPSQLRELDFAHLEDRERKVRSPGSKWPGSAVREWPLVARP